MQPTRRYLYALATVVFCLLLMPASTLLGADAARVVGNLTVTGLVFSEDPGNVITKPLQMGPWSLITPEGLDTNAYFGLTGGFIGIGTAMPTEQLELTGNLKLPATTASAGQIRQGTHSLLHTYGTSNLFVGVDAGNLTMGGYNNTGLGLKALSANTGGYWNTAIGLLSLSGNTTGFWNTATGIFSLEKNQTGYKNTAVGVSSLTSNIGGHDNTATGSQALNSNTAGSYNSAFGSSALSDNTGSWTTAIGSGALSKNTSGYSNTAIGAFSGDTTTIANANVSGSNNTFVGYGAGPGTTVQLDNATAIGAYALVNQSNSLVLGGTGVNAVKVGIGTTTPGATLDALRLIRVLGSTLTSGEWPTSGIGLELAHDSVANKGYIVSYNRTSPAWGSLDIQASTVTIGGGTSSGNLTVSGTLNANNIASGTWSGTAISPAKGGTGLDSSGAVAGSILKTTGTGTWGTLAPGSEGQTLKMSGGSPVWSSSGADATSTFRVLSTAPITWPSSGKGVEIAHDSTSNQGYIQSYDRGASQWGSLAINASTVTIGGTPGNLAVSGVISGNGSGLTNVTPVQGIAGPAPLTIAGGSSMFVFIGPTVTVTTTTSQHIVGSMTAVLGITANSNPDPYFRFDFGICYRQNGTLDDPLTLTPNYTTADMPNEVGRKPYAASSTRVPGIGTWEVGYCVRNVSTADFNDNDYVNGWIMTTN